MGWWGCEKGFLWCLTQKDIVVFLMPSFFLSIVSFLFIIFEKKAFNELSLSWKHDLLNISIHHRRPVWWTFLNGKMGGGEGNKRRLMQTKQKTDVSFWCGCIIWIDQVIVGSRFSPPPLFGLESLLTLGRFWESFGQGSLPPTARREPFNKGEADEDYREFTGARADYLVIPLPLYNTEKIE